MTPACRQPRPTVPALRPRHSQRPYAQGASALRQHHAGQSDRSGDPDRPQRRRPGRTHDARQAASGTGMPLGHGDFVAGAALWIAACKRALTINAIAYSSVASNQIERNVGLLSGANVAGETTSASGVRRPAHCSDRLCSAELNHLARHDPITRSDASNAAFVLWSSSSEMAPGGQSTTTVTRYAIFKED